MKSSMKKCMAVIFASASLLGGFPAIADNCNLDLSDGNVDWSLNPGPQGSTPIRNKVTKALTQKGYHVLIASSWLEQKDSTADYYVELDVECVNPDGQLSPEVPCSAPDISKTSFEFWKNQPAKKLSYFNHSYRHSADIKYTQKLRTFIKNIPLCPSAQP